MYSCALLVILIIGSELVVSQVQFTSLYNGTNVFGYLGSSVNFTWTFTGDILSADFGTKRTDGIAIKDQLVSLRKNGPLKLVLPPLYDGRVNGSWDGTSPGRLTYWLTSIRQEDERIFLCELSSLQIGSLVDQVKLIVRDPPKAQLVSPVSKVMAAREGSSVSFTCNASGIPIPSIRWMRQSGLTVNEIAADNVKYQVISSSGSSQLIINNISVVDDQHYYTCNASSFESHLDSVFLGVISLYENNDSCPSTNQSATRNVSTTICCPVRGFPPPDITWEFPDGTVQKTGNTVLLITPKTNMDFGNYKCIAEGLKETSPDPVIVSINLQEKRGIAVINDTTDKTEMKPGDKFKWDEVKDTVDYLINISGENVNKTSYVGKGLETSVEILYSSLKIMDTHKKGDPVEVNIEVWAIGESRIIGKGGPFTKKILSAATTPKVSFLSVTILFAMTLSLQ